MGRALRVAAAAGAMYGLARVANHLSRPDISGSVAVITGGSRGLGLAIARELAADDVRIVIAARGEEDLEQARRELVQAGAEVLAVPADLRSESDVQRLIGEAADRFGGIDILIHNAGTIQVGPMDHMNDDDFKTAMDVHFWAAHHLFTAARPYLEQSKNPRIVNVASIGGEMAVPHMAPYVASKSALVGYSDTIRSELAGTGIRVTTVSPGLLRTGSHANALFKGKRQKEYAWFAGMQGLPFFSTSAERAARKIVRACRAGQPHVTITIAARLAIAADAIAPNMSSYMRDAATRLLPGATSGDADIPKKGREVDEMPPKTLTHLADREISRHNQ